MFTDDQLRKMNLWQGNSAFESIALELPQAHRHYRFDGQAVALCGFAGETVDPADIAPICDECAFKARSWGIQ